MWLLHQRDSIKPGEIIDNKLDFFQLAYSDEQKNKIFTRLNLVNLTY
jgi:hypothetical protein